MPPSPFLPTSTLSKLYRAAFCFLRGGCWLLLLLFFAIGEVQANKLRPMTFEEIVALKQMGYSDAVLERLIQQTRTRLALTKRQKKRLLRLGCGASIFRTLQPRPSSQPALRRKKSPPLHRQRNSPPLHRLRRPVLRRPQTTPSRRRPPASSRAKNLSIRLSTAPPTPDQGLWLRFSSTPPAFSLQYPHHLLRPAPSRQLGAMKVFPFSPRKDTVDLDGTALFLTSPGDGATIHQLFLKSGLPHLKVTRLSATTRKTYPAGKAFHNTFEGKIRSKKQPVSGLLVTFPYQRGCLVFLGSAPSSAWHLAFRAFRKMLQTLSPSSHLGHNTLR